MIEIGIERHQKEEEEREEIDIFQESDQNSKKRERNHTEHSKHRKQIDEYEQDDDEKKDLGMRIWSNGTSEQRSNELPTEVIWRGKEYNVFKRAEFLRKEGNWSQIASQNNSRTIEGIPQRDLW